MLLEAVGQRVARRHVVGAQAQDLLEGLVLGLVAHQLQGAHDGDARLEDDGELLADHREGLVLDPAAAQAQVDVGRLARLLDGADDEPLALEQLDGLVLRIGLDDAVDSGALLRPGVVFERLQRVPPSGPSVRRTRRRARRRLRPRE